MPISPDLPILYSFRRCPYAMRARLALQEAGIITELREIVLRDKAPAFLAVSPSATVPCLQLLTGEVIDESREIMEWALAQSDPSNWLQMPQEGQAWITEADGPFKQALDRTKYASRYPDCDPEEHRQIAHVFLAKLDKQIGTKGWVFEKPTLADFAILPFVRQFAFIDKARFDAENWPALHGWLEAFLQSDRFAKIMPKYAKWQEGDSPVLFPAMP